MNEELDKKLVTEFPILYRDRYKSIYETCMAWGFTCGGGWFEPIYKLSKKLENLNKKSESPDKPVVIADQVKEKFGGLRFYVSFGENTSEETIKQIDQWICEAETECDNICEVCGESPVQRTSGYIQTLCEKHIKNESS